MFCPNCGNQLNSDTTPFCTQCGSPLKASAQAPVQSAGVGSVAVSVPAALPVAPLTQQAVPPPLPSQSASPTAASPNGAEPSARSTKMVSWLKVAVVLLLVIDGLLNPNVSEALRRKSNADASTADVVKSFFDFNFDSH